MYSPIFDINLFNEEDKKSFNIIFPNWKLTSPIKRPTEEQIQSLLENIDMTKINEKTEESLNNLNCNNTNIYIDPGLGDLIKAKIHLNQMLNDNFLK